MSIKYKLAAIGVIPVILFLILIMFYHIPLSRDLIYQGKERSTRELVNSALGMFDYFHQLEKSGQLSQEEAQDMVVEILRSMTYGEGGQDYFWINDSLHRLVMHPMRADMEGRGLASHDAIGLAQLFDRFGEIVDEHGSGFITYDWQYYDDETRVEPKLSYVAGFEPWQWVVGTGVYINDVQTVVQDLRRLSLFFTSLIILLIGVVVYYTVMNILRPLLETVAFADSVASGNLDKVLKVRNRDEIGSLTGSLNKMVSHLRYLIKRSEAKGQQAEEQAQKAKLAMTDAKSAHQKAEEALAFISQTQERTASQRTAIAMLALDQMILSGDVEKAFDKITKVSSMTLKAARAGIWLVSDDEADLKCISLYEADTGEISRGHLFPIADHPAYFEAIKSDQRIYAIDAYNDPRTFELKDSYLAPKGIFSLLDVGFMVGGKLAGVICLEHVGEKRAWHPDEESFMDTMASLAAQVMGNIKRKEAEDALRMTQFAMDKASDSIIWVGEEGDILYANDSASSSLGYSKDELLKMKVFDIDPDFPADKWEDHKNELRKKVHMRFESRHLTKDGRVFPVEISTNYFEYKGGFLACAFDRDITEARQAQEEREKLQAQLFQSQKMESIGVLAGGVAHDFNNLLHAISGNVQLLNMNKSQDHPDKNRLKIIERSIERASQLVKQLLIFSRKAETQRKALDLNREIQSSASVLKRTIPRMVKLELMLDPDLKPILGDPVQMEQILLNLGSNAADAMPEGGTLLIETMNVQIDNEKGFGLKPGPYVLMSVSDTGVGMDKDILEQIFDPFFTTKDVGQGTGLGLASAYGIVKSHKGEITCYSEPGMGTVFRIYLPALEGSDPEQVDQALDKEIKGGTETILVVDDEQDIRELTMEALIIAGYNALGAAGAREALEIYTKGFKDIDLIILDLGMPDMGGGQCLLEMLKINPQAKVLIASGYSLKGQAGKPLESGAAGYIGKPFRITELMDKVREVLDRDD
ncbi:cache domain-containing protein [Desulfonatronovibrio hydrogenovorans]|uniref:cache domain-containing protein n=1 Tax=Desulfonatronovibrio hydrogenovorans TaxID=53245 RepID=UPI00068CA27E|nr:cache domain-containing protein [Desulfonatronovibrio hydrogenovorans]